MEHAINKLNKIIESLVVPIDENIALFSKAATVEEKRKIAEIIESLTASQKNLSDVVFTLDTPPFDAFDDDFEDDLDDDDFDDFNEKKRINFKGKKKKGIAGGRKKAKDDEDLPF
ncbi:MAG: hypothetical protein JXA18_07965 [Chitinispirillaceae bacterium]|nr:hypothetical protein [Chitinispirillaceae bacterium]